MDAAGHSTDNDDFARQQLTYTNSSSNNNTIHGTGQANGNLYSLASQTSSLGGPPPFGEHQQSNRRHSDSDASAPRMDTFALVRSADGKRWLPAPFSTTVTVSRTPAITSQDQPHQATLLSSPLPPHSCSKRPCAVATLLSTNELLESILKLLSTDDVVHLRHVSRRWADTVNTSPFLRLHLFKFPQWQRPAKHLEILPLTNVPGISVSLGESVHLGQWISITVDHGGAECITPEKARPRARSIFSGAQHLRQSLRDVVHHGHDLATSASPFEANSNPDFEPVQPLHDTAGLYITQPPVRAIEAFIAEKHDEPASQSRPIVKLSCDAGIKLGFLTESAQRLLLENPRGRAGFGEQAGQSKKYKVVFKALVSYTTPTQAPRIRSYARSVTRVDGGDF